MALILPLDLGMSHPETNRVIDEPHEITTQASRFFVPQGGPFFALGLQLRDSTNNLLRPGIDYVALHLNFDATRATGKEVDSIIYVKNLAIAGTVKLSCHYVGGEYSATTDALQQILDDLNVSDGTQFVWGNVLNKPVQYPPAAHMHHIRNLFGADEMVTVLEGIRMAIIEGDAGTLNAIFQYLDQKQQQLADSLPGVFATQAALQAALNMHVEASNAHPKSAVGLSNLDNFPTATQPEALAGTPVDKFVTLRRLMDRLTAMRATVVDIFAATAADKTLAPINQKSIGQKLFSTVGALNPDPNVTLDAYFATAHVNAGSPAGKTGNIMQFFTTSAAPTVNTPRTQLRIGTYDAATPSLASRSFAGGVWTAWTALLSSADIQAAWLEYEKTRIYYVGALYFNTITFANPATILGYGTWVEVAGRVIVGRQTADLHFGILGQQGGEKFHALTADENGPHTHAISPMAPGVVGGKDIGPMPWYPHGGSKQTASSGLGTPHNNMQPYYVASVWRRTA